MGVGRRKVGKLGERDGVDGGGNFVGGTPHMPVHWLPAKPPQLSLGPPIALPV